MSLLFSIEQDNAHCATLLQIKEVKFRVFAISFEKQAVQKTFHLNGCKLLFYNI
jgi:hypothetical protein